MNKPIDLIIVSGFLGSGKTTLISFMLAELSRRRTAGSYSEKTVYVVNEFGKSGLDQTIMQRDYSDAAGEGQLVSYELDSGCICCTMKAEFSQLLGTIIDQHNPDRIIFEPSGLFILSELFNALSGEPYTNRLRIASMICLIDASNDKKNALMYNQLLMNQAQLSDLILVTKLPDSPDEALDTLSEIKLRYPGTNMIASDAAQLTTDDWDKILVKRDRPVRGATRRAIRKLTTNRSLWIRGHAQTDSVVVIPELKDLKKTELMAILERLISGEAGQIVRAKGYLKADGENQLLQMVHSDVSIEPVRADEDSRLVFIGQEINKDRLALMFAETTLA